MAIKKGIKILTFPPLNPVNNIKPDVIRIDQKNVLPFAIKNRLIEDLAITNAKIANLAVDDAKISQLDAGKVTTGILASSDGNTFFDLDTEKRIIINDGSDDRILLGKQTGGF